MRAVLADWQEPSFDDLAGFVARQGRYSMRALGNQPWSDFEAINRDGQAVLAGDVWLGARAREELDELDEFIADLDGFDDARQRVRAHLRDARAVVGLQILTSAYDDSVAAANAVIEFFEQQTETLTQVDTVGWYDGSTLVLEEP